MANQPKIALKQGTAKASGKPYTAISLEIGTWTKLHFPNGFERDYLVKNWKQLEPKVTITATDEIVITAGDYEDTITLTSSLERKYLSDYFRLLEKEAQPDKKDDVKLDLENEDELNENPFGN